MIVKASRGSDLIWESIDHLGNSWFRSHISLYDFSPVDTNDEKVSKALQKTLQNAVRLNSEFLSKWNGYKVETHVEFPMDWGLGSSASLYHLIGQWAEINPLLLYFKIENGSGCDVACVVSESPIVYNVTDDEISYTPIKYSPKFHASLFFVHLNQKQDTAKGIKAYMKVVKKRKELASKITKITREIMETSSVQKFSELIATHEDVIAYYTGFPKVKDVYFSDFSGEVKSLGAWGGDFVLAATEMSNAEVNNYFKDKGFETVVAYKDMVV